MTAANLEGSTLANAILVQTDFTDANLVLADLTNSKIQYAIFTGIHTDGCVACP